MHGFAKGRRGLAGLALGVERYSLYAGVEPNPFAPD